MTSDAIDVRGGDADLGAAIAGQSGAETRIRFVPDGPSDLARALGLTAGVPAGEPVTIDAIRLDSGLVAVNMVVSGLPPDRRRQWVRPRRCVVEVDGRATWDGPATTVLVANGEYLRGHDVVPRGHPGDRRLEVHVHALGGRQRRQMRSRLVTGIHLPHPDIRTAQGSTVTIGWDRPVPLEVDGVGRTPTRAVTARLMPGAAVLVH
ncbi:MAG: hypothetical protein FJW86_12185 [Actinobacteria bacterium]|nr:hypothetical protein [Actinomycetota bacterium]